MDAAALLHVNNRFPTYCTLHCTQTHLDSRASHLLCFRWTLTPDWHNLNAGKIQIGLRGGQLRLSLSAGHFLDPQTEEPSQSECLLVHATPTEQLWQYQPQIFSSPSNTYSGEQTCNLYLNPESGEMSASFEIIPADIRILKTERLWRHDITPNQYAVLERLLAKYAHSFFSGYLSSIYFGRLTPPAHPPQYSSLHPKLTDVQVQAIITQVTTNSTLSLLELAAIADLDPRHDFMGAFLVGTTASNSDWSNAKLCHSNFRGADLTDADFSDADLAGSSLKGADLSGAYLEKANLRQSSFHRASLAVANLIGADLTDADLTSANLSQANLNGAILTGARFGNNIGLDDAAINNFLERGAIFVNE